MKKILVALFVGLMSVVGLSGSAMAVTCPPGSVNSTANSIAECNIDQSQGTQDLMGTAQGAINVVIGIVGLVAVVVMIIGGVYFILSQGDAAKIARAKNTILYGLIGLGVALLSYAIVNFVLKSVF